MSPHPLVLTVLPVALSRMEQRVFDAALTLSSEQHRALSYRHHDEASPDVPDLVVVASGGAEQWDRYRTRYLASADPATIPQITLGAHAAVGASYANYQSSTPFGILTSLDRAARIALGAHNAKASTVQRTLLPRQHSSAPTLTLLQETLSAGLSSCLDLRQLAV